MRSTLDAPSEFVTLDAMMSYSNGASFNGGQPESIFGNLEPWWFRVMRPIQDRGQTWG